MERRENWEFFPSKLLDGEQAARNEPLGNEKALHFDTHYA